jgi:hypothetical protein
MPSPEQILAGLASAANKLRMLAVFWHVYLAGAVVALMLGARPSRRVAGLLLVPLALSVSVAAWSVGNPFNGLVFALLSVALGVLSLRFGKEPIGLAPA